MEKKTPYILTFLCFCTIMMHAQSNSESFLQGKVSFVTSKNVYVKFENTDNIQIGDTLYLSENNEYSPCLIVHHKSKTSCASSMQNNCILKKDALVYHKEHQENKIHISPQTPMEAIIINQPVNDSIVVENKKIANSSEQKINARLMVATYSTLANNNSRHKVAYRFNINANNIRNSKFSAESYVNYWNNYLPKDKVFNQQTNYLRVYSLALRYELNNTTTIDIGRKVNQKFSSVGAIDGIQGEKYFGKNYAGLIMGFRPDIYNFGFNSNLLQYGAYIGRSTNSNKFNSETSFGIIEQHNQKAIDRRYAYFQHNSNLFQNINLFSSVEADLYNQINGISSNDFRITNLYTSLNYRFGRWMNLGVSYDSRKQIIYYETFRTDIERMLDDDIARQGMRARISIRPFNTISIGGSYALRFQSNNQNQSTNINSFVSISNLPVIKGSLNINYNYNASNYLLSKIISSQYYTDLTDKLSFEAYARFVNYDYSSGEKTSNIKYFGSGFSYKINKKYSLSLLGEITDQIGNNTFRINTRITRRF